jgi:hypothetical protein
MNNPSTPERGRRLPKIFYLVAAGAAALGLIGLGAFAIFSSQTSSSQAISLGQAPVVNLSTSAAGAAGQNTPALTFAAYAAGAYSFTTGDQEVTASNTGSLAASDVNGTLSETDGGTPADLALYGQVDICVVNSVTNNVVWNTGLQNAIATAATMPFANSVGAGASLQVYTVNIFAGGEVTACGGQSAGATASSGLDGAAPLTASASGGSLSMSLTALWQ